MATSGSKSIAVTKYDTLKFSWERTSVSTTNNTSTISWKLQLISTKYGKIISTASKDWKVVVNGETFKGTNKVGIAASSTKTLASDTLTIKHKSDGTKTFDYSFSQEFAITFSGNYIGTKSGSGSGTLNTIPRESVLSVADGTLGTAQTLKITEYSSGYTHKLSYKCGTASGYILGDSDSTSKTLSTSWTPPLSLAKQDTTSPDCSVDITFTLTTYSGSTKIGSSQTSTKAFKMPSSIKPTVPSITVSETTSYAKTYGGYVQNKSGIKISASASGSYGSTIKSYAITIDGKTHKAADTYTPTSSGKKEIKVTATDSRGRTNSATTTIDVLAYANPKFTKFNVRRDDQHDTVIHIDYAATCSALKGNSVSIVVHNAKSSTVQTTNASGTLTIEDVSDKTISNIYAVATDSLGSKGESSHKTVLAPLRIISVYKDGNGVAFGKKAENANRLESAWDAYFYGGVFAKDPSDKFKSLIDLTHPVGSVFVTSNSKEDPSKTIGGTWTLINKSFTSNSLQDNTLFTPTSSVKSHNVYITRNGNHIRLRLYVLFATNVVDDGGTVIGTFNYSKIGVTALPFSVFQQPCGCDGGHAVILCTLDYASGELSAVEIIPHGNSTNGSATYFDVDLTIRSDLMINSFCDQFYWKRTK